MNAITNPIKNFLPAVAVFLGLVACAATPPAKPITSMSSIAGDWKGTFWDNRGAQYPGTMTISQAGDYKTERMSGRGPQTGGGKLTIRDGKAFTDGGSAVSLHDRDGKPVLILNTRSGGQGEYTKVK
jgi:hypothetical protein